MVLSKAMTRQEKIKFIALRTVGNFLVLMSLYGVAATFGPAAWYEIKFRTLQARGVKFTVVETPRRPQENDGGGVTFGSLLDGRQEQELVPPDTSFSIVIPKIGAASRIIPNVDPVNQDIYKKALLEGVAHAKGTVFPGLPGNTYIFSHSTDNWWNVGRYNAIFYLLKDMEPGDEVVIFFEGRRYNYIVDRKYTAEPNDVSLLRNSQGGEEQLVLQTCWPPGTTWKRLFVVAKPASTFGDIPDPEALPTN